jgi:peptidoglycan/LPS O-acetylase OafA/YrhL
LVVALKAVASQLIVLHHLAFYGPMADAAMEVAPALISWLSQDARIAVQVFLVVGGFLAARSLAPRGILVTANPLAHVWRRYLRLLVPYLAALVFSVGCAVVARRWMTHESIPDVPTIRQLLAHLLLSQNVLGFDSLSAGIWYVAVDFQLFTLFLLVLWIARGIATGTRSRLRLGLLCVAGLGAASLFHFNRDAIWDTWALYFFAAYALGALAYWASARDRSPAWLGMIVLVVLAALSIAFRSRIAIALGVALALGAARRTGIEKAWPTARPIDFLGEISYSVFLVHFPVCLVVNALFTRFAPQDPVVQSGGMLLAWAASVAAGACFFRYIETPARERTGKAKFSSG